MPSFERLKLLEHTDSAQSAVQCSGCFLTMLDINDEFLVPTSNLLAFIAPQ